jgi:hypothetical protein
MNLQMSKISLTLLFMLGLMPAHAEVPKAAIFPPSELGRIVAQEVQAAGYAPVFVGADVITNSAKLASEQIDLLILPEASGLPVAAMASVRQYLQAGGGMMAFGLPAWQSPTYEVGGKLISRKDYESLLDSRITNNVLIDFAHEDLSKWSRGADLPSTTTDLDVVRNGEKSALHVKVEQFGSWDNVTVPPLPDPFGLDRTLTCFRAKGDSNTPEMSIEWVEEDGTRWIAVVGLTPQWKSYFLPVGSFHSWDAPAGRGGEGDRLNVRRARRLRIGLALSHNVVSGGEHEFWMENIGTAASPFGRMPLPDEVNPPHLETFSPGWKFYPLHGSLKFSTPEGLAFLQPAEWPASAETEEVAMQPRPRAIGFNQERPWRWQPLLEARAPDGDYRGAVATLLIHFDDDSKGGMWADFSPGSPSFYESQSARQLIRQTAQAMRRGVFLQEGGSEFFTAFENQKFYLGARAANLGKLDQSELAVEISVKSKNGGQVFYDRKWQMSLLAGGAKTVQEEWQSAEWPEGGLSVTTELTREGKSIDRLEHDLNVWHPPAHPQFVEETAGEFEWRGRPWKINGVNYMPATVIGIDKHREFDNWLGKGGYDPEVIDRDLRRVKAMNLNTVSIFVDYGSMKAQHLLDFLRRCQNAGLHVNQALRPSNPMNFQWDKIKQLIEFYHLAENDTIFAYDLSWEPMHRNQQGSYGADWTAWVTRRYGSPAQAEKVWGVSLSHFDENTLNVPPMRQLAHDGAWRILAADYRAFLDTELADKYGEARRLVRSIDPHHAVSFRMTETSDPTFISDRELPYDFYGLSRAVDIWEPEGYGRIGDWNRVRDGRFEVDYARLCNPQLPLIWAELGISVWDERRGGDSTEKLRFAGQFAKDFYRMSTEAGCDGVIFWYYPGSYRVDERSDFGIINGDGTDRPISRVIREEGARFLEAPKPPAPDYVIKVNRDRDARGVFGVYQTVKTDYWQAIAAGKRPRLEWEKTPGEQPALNN